MNRNNQNFTRRAPFHDYRLPGTYLITLVAKYRQKLFGKLRMGSNPYVYYSDLGRRIFIEQRPMITDVYPDVVVWKTCIMPDHIHLITHVYNELPNGKHLGNVISGFKLGCNGIYREITGDSHAIIFEKNYNDRLVMHEGQVNAWKRYLDDNPRRLALKKMYPDLFHTRYNKALLGRSCQIFGNMFLLNMPGRMSVIVHSADTDDMYKENFDKWMQCGEHGGVLVGAFISKRERAVKEEALARGYALIELCEHGFGSYYKPSGLSFDACAEGLLLQICPYESQYTYGHISRWGCLQLNAFADEIAAADTFLV